MEGQEGSVGIAKKGLRDGEDAGLTGLSANPPMSQLLSTAFDARSAARQVQRAATMLRRVASRVLAILTALRVLNSSTEVAEEETHLDAFPVNRTRSRFHYFRVEIRSAPPTAVCPTLV